MMVYTDKIVQKIVDKLKEKDVWENTIFIFTSDNGTHFSVISDTNHGKVTGGKGFSINTGNHVPMIAGWRAKMKKGRVFENLIDFSDVLPTLGEAAGADMSNYKMDGKSFLNILKGVETSTKDEVFIHYSPRWGAKKHNRWVMNGEYKLYRDGRYFKTLNDTLEKNPLTIVSENENELKKHFQKLIDEKEKEFPYNRNDTIYNPLK